VGVVAAKCRRHPDSRSGEHHTLIFNPSARLSLASIGSRHHCLVVDEALVDPERVRQLAAERQADFRPIEGNAYPGICLAAPDALTQELGELFARSVRRHFDARRLIRMHCRYSLVTLAPAALRPFQGLCHRDGETIASDQSIQASVLYLFRDERLGGTSFYEPSRSVAETAALFADSRSLSAAEFTERYGLLPGYIQHTNGYFKCLGSVPARWNRMIFYDGSMLHSGDIDHPEGLSADPLQGRLTLNGFFTSRRNAK
jgi:hypothetical protein